MIYIAKSAKITYTTTDNQKTEDETTQDEIERIIAGLFLANTGKVLTAIFTPSPEDNVVDSTCTIVDIPRLLTSQETHGKQNNHEQSDTGSD